MYLKKMSQTHEYLNKISSFHKNRNGIANGGCRNLRAGRLKMIGGFVTRKIVGGTKKNSRIFCQSGGADAHPYPFTDLPMGIPTAIDDNTALKYLSCFNVEHVRKLKVIKHLLTKVGNDDHFERLAMIDSIQRLGIDYHFQEEIKEILHKEYIAYAKYDHHNPNLEEATLRFRLLRQQGYNVSATDMFNNLKDKEGKFKKNLSEDVKGLMSIYEASQLSTEVEDDHILNEAGVFSAKLLDERLRKNGTELYQERVIRNTLVHPYHKTLPRFMINQNICLNVLQGQIGWIHVLQEVAKMDFNMVKSLHQMEIVQVSNRLEIQIDKNYKKYSSFCRWSLSLIRWWKELGLSKKFEFARDQPIKWYIWSMASITDPSLSDQRVDLVKPISLIYIIDDIFDVRGTLDELTLFTKTIDRWNVDAIDQLPDYMRICFEALDDITNEISNKVFNFHGYNPLHCLRKVWSSLCNAFLTEANWFHSGFLPNAEEYLKNGVISSGVFVYLTHIFFLLGEGITRENVQLIETNPHIISSAATILRLWDDLGSAKDENQSGTDGSYIYYYMKEHGDRDEDSIDESGARQHAINKISDAWKCLNQECLLQEPFSASFKRACLNFARMVPLMYDYDENQRLPILEEYIKSILCENIPTYGVY